MRVAWAGVGVASVGLVLAALLWFFAATGGSDSDPPVCTGRFGDEVPCVVAGVDMSYAGLLSFVVFGDDCSVTDHAECPPDWR